MKLANIHKHYFVLLLIIGGFQSAQAQTWTLQQCIDTAQVHNKNLHALWDCGPCPAGGLMGWKET